MHSLNRSEPKVSMRAVQLLPLLKDVEVSTLHAIVASQVQGRGVAQDEMDLVRAKVVGALVLDPDVGQLGVEAVLLQLETEAGCSWVKEKGRKKSNEVPAVTHQYLEPFKVACDQIQISIKKLSLVNAEIMYEYVF